MPREPVDAPSGYTVSNMRSGPGAVLLVACLLCACRRGEGHAEAGAGTGGSATDGAISERGGDGPATDSPMASPTIDAGGADRGMPKPFVPGAVVAGRQVQSLHAADQMRQLDLLFMIDNSGSVTQEQNSLLRHFPAFIKALEALPGGLPDLHIAIVSPDLGAGPTARDGCRPGGDGGRFLVQPGCGLDQGTFLRVDGKGNKNFSGDLATVFSCLARLGTAGCNQEQPLQSIRLALSDANPDSKAFLRKDAHLAIVLLTDEDDCSADADTAIFDEVRPGEALSFRCNALGHVCDGRPLPAEAFSTLLAGCQPYRRSAAERTSRLINVEELADFIKQLKPGRPDQITVSAVIGWTGDANAQYRTARSVPMGTLDVQPICVSSNGQAQPAVRLKAFVDAFGASGTVRSICDSDFVSAVSAIGKSPIFELADSCIGATLSDTEPAQDGLQAECRVVDRVPRPGGAAFDDQPLPACGMGALPCWELASDPTCPRGQRLRINRATPAPPGALVASSCRGEDSPPYTCGNVPCPVPAVMAGPGERCNINIDTGTPTLPVNLALWRGDDRVCKSHLCVRPAPDFQITRAVDTSPLCTDTCVVDDDCTGAAMRNPANAVDKRCARGFACGVAFETGPLRCQRLCLCKDFLPPDGPRPATSCP